MKKRAIPIAVVVISTLALALTLASLRAPSMQVASVDSERVVLEADGDCAYTAWLNHAPICTDCRYYDGVRVISATSFSRLEVYWNALDIGAPAAGGCFCGHWHCYSEAEWHGGELWATVAWRLWLPVVMSDG